MHILCLGARDLESSTLRAAPVSVNICIIIYLVASLLSCTYDFDVCQGFGGITGGPGPLKRLHEEINEVLGPLVGKPITITAIVDLMNLTGRCVRDVCLGLCVLGLTCVCVCVCVCVCAMLADVL